MQRINKTDEVRKNSRIHEIIAQLRRFSEGDFNYYLPISDKVDEIDAIIAGLNRLGEILMTRDTRMSGKDDRIPRLLQVLQKYTTMDLSEKAGVSPQADEIDALATGLNVLGKQVSDHNSLLEDNEEQINTIFKNAPDAVVVADRHSVIVRWNPAASRIFGWTEEEVLGKFLHLVLIPDRYRDRHLAGVANFLISGEGPILNKTIEMPALRKDGSEIVVELTISAAKRKDEYLFISFLRDITARKKSSEEIRLLNNTLEQRVLERTEQLIESEKKYRQLFDNNPMPMWVLEIPTHRFLDVNESAIQQYGYSRDEFLSMTAVDIRPENDKAKYLDLDRSRSLYTKNAGVWAHIKKDGTQFYTEITAHDIIFEGKPARLILSSDVTEKIKAEAALRYSEARFRRIFDSRLIGFLLWNVSGEITEVNDVFLDMIGYTREDFVQNGLQWNKITPPEYAGLDEIAVKQIGETGVSDPFEKEYLRKDGRRLPALVAAAAVDESLRVSYIMDISQRKKMEEEILELNRNLESRVVMRTQELEAANRELESFSYSVSHDLRAPLRAIHGYSQMLSEDYGTSLDAEGLRLLGEVRFNAKKMGQLVDDLLTFSRMGKRAINKTYCDLNEIVNDVIAQLNNTGEMRAAIEVHSLGFASVDAALLHHVFQNLISNAVKYSSRKENPVVELGVHEKNGVKIWYVKDNGAGFDMQYYDKLFGVFQRLHGDDEFEGTGVGLAIVQRIITRHGGKVWAESREGEGATFYFTLDQA